MTSLRQLIHIIFWLLTPEPSDNKPDNHRSLAGNRAETNTPLPYWIKTLFWYGIALTITLFIGNPE